MDPTSTPTTAHKPTLNGTLKRHQVRHPQPHPPPSSFLYRECLKNHAASLGGHALDGCGEYMPSSSFNPADPSSLTCAACGCHRNFHRRLHRQNHLPFPPHLNNEDNDNDKDDQEEEEEEEDDDEHFAGSVDGGCGDEVSRPRQHPTSPPPPSAPHMLLALSTGVAAPARKRFRSKFSPEQKERMQELSERLRWRMQKRDEGLIAERCHEIGVGKGVFKVWMHNNKHNFNKQQQQQLRSDDINGPPPPPSS